MNLLKLNYLSRQYLVKASQLSRYQIKQFELLFSSLHKLTAKKIKLDDFAAWIDNLPPEVINKLANCYSIGWFKQTIKCQNMFGQDGAIYISKNKIEDPAKFFIPIMSDSQLYQTKVALLSSEFFTPAIGSIPKLYFYDIEYKNTFKTPQEFQQSKQHQFKFLYDYLIRDTRDWTINPEEADEFIRQNKEKIGSLLSSFEYLPKFLGRGEGGVAFDVGKNMVLKLFKNDYILNKTLEAYTRLYSQDHPNVRTEAMLYDVGELTGKDLSPGNYSQYSVYYYIIEKLETAETYGDDTLAKIQNYIINKFELNADLKKLNINDPLLKMKINQFTNKIIQDPNLAYLIEKFEQEHNLNPKWLQLFVEEIVIKMITGRTDLHTGNLGLTKQRTIKYFDPTHFEPTPQSE